MRIDLSGKTALVTASSEGIGFATARRLLEAGASVIVNGRNVDKVDAAVAELKTIAGDVHGIAADVGTTEGCAALIEGAPKVDILVNNAAAVPWGDIFESDDAAWNQSWTVNVMSGVRLSRHYLRGMQEADWGRLIFISSESARNIAPDLLAYGASKSALHAVSRGIAKRMAGTGITSNVVVPGPTLSTGVERLFAGMAKESGGTVQEAAIAFIGKNRPSSIIKRPATVEEVSAMIVYLCSPIASATTGAALRVDGGVIDDVN